MKVAGIRFTMAVLLISGMTHAETSANIGWASDYFYRGVFQANSSASVGIEYEGGGFYLGSWAADVGDGLEVDAYFGYGGDVGAVSYGIGFTGYYYTQDFDDTYEEINLSAGYGIVNIDVAIGRYDNFDVDRQKYTYYALTLEKKGFYGKYAGFAQDFAGEYFEIGYTTSTAVLDFGVSVILANAALVGETDESIVFSVSKLFDF